MRAAAMGLVLLFAACRMPWQEDTYACADSARLDMPVDLAAFAAGGSIYPFGIHGGNHPEGHPGIDLFLPATESNGDIAVKASFSAAILSITPESGFPGGSCIVLDSACVEVNLCHVVLDPALKPGDRVSRGQKLGTVAFVPAENRYSLHFGTYSGQNADLRCPADFLDPDTVECRLGLSAGGKAPAHCGYAPGTVTLMGRSEYEERFAREITVACVDGGTQTFARPEETSLCAPRLDAADRKRLDKCLGPACAGIW